MGDVVERVRCDAWGRGVRQWDAAGTEVEISYGMSGTTTITEAGQVTVYEYDDHNLLVRMSDAESNEWTYAYDPEFNLVSLNAYDDGDNLIRTTRNYTTAGGQNYLDTYNLVTEHAYDPVGRRIVTTDTLGSVTRSWYENGQLISTTANYSPTLLPGHGPGNGWNRTTWYGYDAAGRQVAVTDTLGNGSYTAYDGQGRVTERQDALGNTTRYGYDAVGNQVLVTDTLGYVTRSWYDGLDRLVSTTVNNSPTVGQKYQNQWNITTWYAYDPVGNQVAVTDTSR